MTWRSLKWWLKITMIFIYIADSWQWIRAHISRWQLREDSFLHVVVCTIKNCHQTYFVSIVKLQLRNVERWIRMLYSFTSQLDKNQSNGWQTVQWRVIIKKRSERYFCIQIRTCGPGHFGQLHHEWLLFQWTCMFKYTRIQYICILDQAWDQSTT